MTGFGRATHNTEQWLAIVEASSINRKQIEVVINLPRILQSLETLIRQLVLPQISRGRIQLSVRLEKPDGMKATAIQVNSAAALALENAFRELSSVIGREVLPKSADFYKQPGIFECDDFDQIDPDSAWQAIQPALERALASMNEMRKSEGDHLKQDFITRIDMLEHFTQTIAELAPIRPQRQREMLEKRLSEIGLSIDSQDERLSKEIALFADRCDVSEELTRLQSHYTKFGEYLHSSEPTGRQLDFLCQELFREFNTIGSKANDSRIAQTVVEAKTEIEKIREQVQNIE